MYTVEIMKEGQEGALVSQFVNQADAIEKARELAATVDGAETLIVVNHNGEEIWNNEGDWRNANTF